MDISLPSPSQFCISYLGLGVHLACRGSWLGTPQGLQFYDLVGHVTSDLGGRWI